MEFDEGRVRSEGHCKTERVACGPCVLEFEVCRTIKVAIGSCRITLQQLAIPQCAQSHSQEDDDEVLQDRRRVTFGSQASRAGLARRTLEPARPNSGRVRPKVLWLQLGIGLASVGAGSAIFGAASTYFDALSGALNAIAGGRPSLGSLGPKWGLVRTSCGWIGRIRVVEVVPGELDEACAI